MKFQGEALDYFDVEKFVSNIFGDTQHTKRIKSIASAALGVISSASLIIHRIGRGMARVMNLSDKHAVKQVDRLLSNQKLKLEDVDKKWIPFLIGSSTPSNKFFRMSSCSIAKTLSCFAFCKTPINLGFIYIRSFVPGFCL